MQYMLLIYGNDLAWSTLPEEERQAMMQEYFAYTDELKQSGKYIAGDALQPVSTAKTIQVRNGETLTTDGPFAETKEQLGGYFLVEAEDLDAAVAIAARIPAARLGSIEVRPLWQSANAET